MSKKIKVAITQGDHNSVAYEVILKALEDSRIADLCTPVIYGSARIAHHYGRLLGLNPVRLCQIDNPAQARDEAISIINCVPDDLRVEPGQQTPQGGQGARAALELAVQHLREGKVDVLVTGPINKENIQTPDFQFPGHTDYLQATLGHDSQQALMILCTPQVRVALVTTHVPVSQIAGHITTESVLAKIRAFNASLTSDFGILKPRIAVLALNPHSGDGGVIGTEEQTAITPAIRQAMSEKIFAFGPYAADGFWGAGLYRNFDGVLAMYHDQGLAPFKTLAMEGGVNFTAGLDKVRTSPDHGTAFDIAGQGVASAESMRQAIYMALDAWRNRQRHQQATHNPLRRQYFDKGKDNVVLDLS